MDLLPHAVQERIRFFVSFLRSPLSVGSITPSSEFLAREMVKCVPWDQVSLIVELGAGTGVFTRHIHEKKSPDAIAVIYERDDVLRAELMKKFPGLGYRDDAMNLEHDLLLTEAGAADVILSGLPFAAFPPDRRDRMLDAVHRSLKPGGLFVMFQYSPQMLGQLRKRFSRMEVSLVFSNLPPAIVYTCFK
ncbi:class I SAM-dependent methyltransferase [Staphylospora marina]|uniref:class I SAM-dependent methyltransferase n=1 Tax=Staphylospora marina TaxID=2490858 RepID=UPI000F5B9771|nr:methyltransferase domain-containing protein [Staphylospora marina]